MKNILILGAGRSSTALINYLLKESKKNNWFVTIADYNLEIATRKVNNHSNGRAIKFDIYNKQQRQKEISAADIVISLLLPSMHIIVAKECLKQKRNMVTASYVSNEMAKLDDEVKKSDLIFMNEIGLDPGIDHMDAMRLINKIKNSGGDLISLHSYCGGLTTDQSNTNPWGYKFTWSPMNVVLAGQGVARYIEENKIKIIPYNRLFKTTESIFVNKHGEFEAYPNRDSIPYLKKLGIENIENYRRSTLRRPGYCEAWNCFVKLGITDNSYLINDSQSLTYKEWVAYYLSVSDSDNIENRLAEFGGISPESEIMDKIKWLDILSDRKIKVKNGTPAEILLDLLLDKWEFKEEDRDKIILQTEAIYKLKEEKRKIKSTIIYEGKDNQITAMTTTVGLPAAIATKLILQNKIKEKGVVIPVYSDIYFPILKELEEEGIKLEEEENIF